MCCFPLAIYLFIYFKWTFLKRSFHSIPSSMKLWTIYVRAVRCHCRPRCLATGGVKRCGVLDDFHSHPAAFHYTAKSHPTLNGAELPFFFFSFFLSPHKPRLCRFIVKWHVLISTQRPAAPTHTRTHSEPRLKRQRESAASCSPPTPLKVARPPSAVGVCSAAACCSDSPAGKKRRNQPPPPSLQSAASHLHSCN